MRLVRTLKKARSETLPIMMPKAVHICHIMIRAPRMAGGAHPAV